MMTIANPRVLVFTGALSALMVCGGADAAAQWGPRVGIGYVVNAPNQYVGASAHVLTRALGGLGLYVDGKFTVPSARDKDNFQEEWTAQYVDDNFGDIPFTTDEQHRSFNAALMRPVTPELILYAGAGLTERAAFVEYRDETGERGNLGFYWVEDPDQKATGLNVLGGAFFRIGRNVALQFGAEAEPRGLTIGASYSIPLGR